MSYESANMISLAHLVSKSAAELTEVEIGLVVSNNACSI